jgi:hypothetical protein
MPDEKKTEARDAIKNDASLLHETKVDASGVPEVAEPMMYGNEHDSELAQ